MYITISNIPFSLPKWSAGFHDDLYEIYMFFDIHIYMGT